MTFAEVSATGARRLHSAGRMQCAFGPVSERMWAGCGCGAGRTRLSFGPGEGRTWPHRSSALQSWDCTPLHFCNKSAGVRPLLKPSQKLNGDCKLGWAPALGCHVALGSARALPASSSRKGCCPGLAGPSALVSGKRACKSPPASGWNSSNKTVNLSRGHANPDAGSACLLASCRSLA